MPKPITRSNVASFKDTAEERIRRYKIQEAKKHIDKIIYSPKLDSYLEPEWDYTNKPLHDLVLKTYSDSTTEGVMTKAIADNWESMDAIIHGIKIAYYINRIYSNDKVMLIFYGKDENEIFTKAMIKRASYVPWVPHVTSGKIVNKVDDALILKVIFQYDREYGLYLKKLKDQSSSTSISS